MGLFYPRSGRSPGLRVGLALLVTLIAAPAVAQLERGSISGTISDQSGAVVPGVTVTATNAQQQQRVAVTDGSGFYTFPNLLSGRYSISAELQASRRLSARTSRSTPPRP